MNVIHIMPGRLTPSHQTSNACGSGAFSRVSGHDRQYCAARHAVTSLVGLPIYATTSMLHVFSIQVTCKGEQTMLAPGERLTRGGDVGLRREWGQRWRRCWDYR